MGGCHNRPINADQMQDGFQGREGPCRMWCPGVLSALGLLTVTLLACLLLWLRKKVPGTSDVSVCVWCVGVLVVSVHLLHLRVLLKEAWSTC